MCKKTLLPLFTLLFIGLPAQAETSTLDGPSLSDQEGISLAVDGGVDVPLGSWSSNAAGLGLGIFIQAEQDATIDLVDKYTLRLGYIRRLSKAFNGGSVNMSHLPVLVGAKVKPSWSDFYFTLETGLSRNFASGNSTSSVIGYGNVDVDTSSSSFGLAAALGAGYKVKGLDIKAGFLLPDFALWGDSQNMQSFMISASHKFHTL